MRHAAGGGPGCAGRYMELLAPLLAVTAEDLRAGLALFARAEGLGAFDAVLAAAAIGSTSALVSADTAFARVAELTHVIPDADGVRGLLSSHA